MLRVAKQAIRSAVGLPFEIVKVLHQHHSSWSNNNGDPLLKS